MVSHTDASMLALLKQVASDRRIQLMLPVYVPIISLYGLVISKAKHIIEVYFSLSAPDMLALFGMLGGSLFLGIVVMGHLSDYLMKTSFFIMKISNFVTEQELRTIKSIQFQKLK